MWSHVLLLPLLLLLLRPLLLIRFQIHTSWTPSPERTWAAYLHRRRAVSFSVSSAMIMTWCKRRQHRYRTQMHFISRIIAPPLFTRIWGRGLLPLAAVVLVIITFSETPRQFPLQISSFQWPLPVTPAEQTKDHIPREIVKEGLQSQEPRPQRIRGGVWVTLALPAGKENPRFVWWTFFTRILYLFFLLPFSLVQVAYGRSISWYILLKPLTLAL